MKPGISSYAYVWAVGVPGWPSPRPLDVDGLLDEAVRLAVPVLQIESIGYLRPLVSGELS